MNFIFPPTCLACSVDLPLENRCSLCPTCHQSLLAGSTVSFKCPEPFKAMCWAGSYDGALRGLIHNAKYRGKDYVCDLLTTFCLNRWRVSIDLIDVLVFVPASSWKWFVKGFHAPRSISQNVSRIWNKKILFYPLKRRMWSSSQTKLHRQERIQNAGRSFFLGSQSPEVRGKNVLLIDDVYTTGSTMIRCAKLLKKAGAREIFGAVVAYEPPGQAQLLS